MKKRKELFQNWIEEQSVFQDVDLNKMSFYLRKQALGRLRKMYEKQYNDLQTLSVFFGLQTGCDWSSKSVPFSEQDIKKHFSKLYSLLQDDIEEFINYLKNNNFCSQNINKQEEKQTIGLVIKKYNSFFDILFNSIDGEKKKDEFLFTVSNQFFEFCFFQKTSKKFQKMLKDASYYPILRMFYSIMWRHLAEHGWQHWHADALQVLKKEADAGKEIVYIAGGTDIYQLIKHGIYNIRVIDPLLSTQPKYYSQHWDWFIEGEVGEEVLVPHAELTMKRASQEKSVTVWQVRDGSGKDVGQIKFERRYANQNDFYSTSKRALLMSCNELYFISAPDEQEGWGIDPHAFDKSLNIIIKQLKNPVSKQVMCNMSYEGNQEEFMFIHLGTSVT